MKPSIACKRLLARVQEQQFGALAVPEPALDEEPALPAAPSDVRPSSTAVLCCPSCGEMEARVQQVQDAEVELSGGDAEDPEEILLMAVCRSCGAVSSPPEPSAAATVIADVLGEQARLLRRLGNLSLAEVQPPVRGLTR